MADNPITDDNNVVLYDDLGNKIGVPYDGSLYRLACNMDGSEVIISDSESATKYQLQTDFDATGDVLNTSTDTVLFAETGSSGTLDFQAISGSNSNFEAVIEIDGTERIRITMAEIGAIGLSNATNVPLWAETALKNFRYSPNLPIGYTTGFRILAKATKTPLPTVTHLTMYRERVT